MSKYSKDDSRAIKDMKLDEFAGLLNEYDVNTIGALVDSLDKAKKHSKRKGELRALKAELADQKDEIKKLHKHIDKLIDKVKNK
ncbi:hypothetical protein [Limosilactobacillus pontis]|uniref:Uncharacterized protein n=1 Tax=Limosilactobacillus pontis TaxID=35787 RepID=A0ABU7SR54_9LACO|nr:hypothetical protein [Limosilactobacillus pontis]